MLVTLLLAALLLSGCSSREHPSIDHVVVVVLDATHAAHLGSHGGDPAAAPHLDGLAARGLRFAAAHSNTTWTLPSSVSLLSGLRPETHGVVTAQQGLPADLAWFPEQLAAAGFATAGWSQMVFASERHGLERGFQRFASLRPRTEGLVQARDGLAAFLDEGHPRSFAYLHLRRPHSPYTPDPAYQQPFEADCPLADGRSDQALRFVDNKADVVLDEDERRHLAHLYRANLRQVDEVVGWLVERLGERLERDTLLVVTSDHGDALGEHGHYGHRDEVSAEVVRVPLIVVGPGVPAAVVEQPVATVDLVPSLAELLDLAAPAGLDGTSWAPAVDGRAWFRAPLRIAGRRTPGAPVGVAAVGPTVKLTRRPDGALQVHDWRADPAETTGLLLAEVPAAERATLQRLVDELVAWRPAGPGAPAGGLSAEQEQDLRRLGYLGEDR